MLRYVFPFWQYDQMCGYVPTYYYRISYRNIVSISSCSLHCFASALCIFGNVLCSSSHHTLFSTLQVGMHCQFLCLSTDRLKYRMFQPPSVQQLDDTGQCVCVCQKYREPHIVSIETWYRHLRDAGTEEEKAKIRSGRVLQGGSLLPLGHSITAASSRPVASGSAIPSWDVSEPPNVRNTAAANALAREDEDDSAWRLGRRKRARMLTTDPASVCESCRLID
jgi:hypothetical protein